MRARLFVETRRIRGKRALANARGSWTERGHVLATLVDDEGNWGMGEAAPLAGHSPETVEEAESELSAIGALELPDVLPQDVGGWLRASSLGLRHASSRFALETVLLDWAGRRWERPAAALLGAAPGSMPVCAVVDGQPSTWNAQVRHAAARGYGTVKLKVSPRTIRAAFDRLPMLHRNIPELRWRLDANGSLPPALLAELRDRLPFLELVEEPFAPGAAITGLPIALDESMQRSNWELIAREQGARFVVLKPMALGGIGATLERAARARERGLRVVVSYLWEGPVGWAASIAVALAIGDRDLAQGLAPHAQLKDWPAFVVESFDAPSIRTTASHGLGMHWSG